jgi:hypothetical protein
VRSAGRPIALHLRAPSPEKYTDKDWPTDLPRKIERDLVSLWRENYDQNALTALVEAHRPMVAHMAQGRVGSKRKIIIEYGIFGLRFAVSPQWANRRNKGKPAGYDPTKAKFNTYARHHAKRFMIAAAQAMAYWCDKRGYFWEPPLEDKKEEFDEWYSRLYSPPTARLV